MPGGSLELWVYMQGFSSLRSPSETKEYAISLPTVFSCAGTAAVRAFTRPPLFSLVCPLPPAVHRLFRPRNPKMDVSLDRQSETIFNTTKQQPQRRTRLNNNNDIYNGNNNKQRQRHITRYLYVFEHPCCGACDLLCFSCTGRARAFHRARSSSKWAATNKAADSATSDDDNDKFEHFERGGEYFATGRGGGEWKEARAETSTTRDPASHDREASGAASSGSPPGTAAVARGDRISRAEDGGDGGGGGERREGGGGEAGNDDKAQVSIRSDNWLGTHEAGLLRVAGLHAGCEVVDAQFASGVAATPYCVLVDHDWRCVVVSIRGTMSLEDCLVDLQADPVCMDESGRRWGFDGSGMFAHQVCMLLVWCW